MCMLHWISVLFAAYDLRITFAYLRSETYMVSFCICFVERFTAYDIDMYCMSLVPKRWSIFKLF